MSDTKWHHAVGTADASVERGTVGALAEDNKMKLGLFATNLSGGLGGVTTAEGTLKIGDWSETLEIAKVADKSNIDAIIPIGRWKGFGGPSKQWDRSFEVFTWAAALAQATERINVFATCHAGLINPVMAAKMGATVDHISGGRWGLNVVAGWLESEFNAFGVDFVEHDKRYEIAAEWLEVVKRLWTEEDPFDFDGQFFHLKGAISEPRPVQAPYPTIMNAGQSSAGMEFSATHADQVYILMMGDVKETVERARDAAARAGREISVWGIEYFNVKDTEEEAIRSHDYFAKENADYETTKRWAAEFAATDTSWAPQLLAEGAEGLEKMHEMLARAGTRKLIGTPEMAAEDLAWLSEAGIDGVGMFFIENMEGIERYRDQVLPLLRAEGLRQ